ncbi:hypothetical protein BsWGS_01378 [Bradybaena similaris]
MHLFQTDSHYILSDGEYSLWCSRLTGKLEPKTGSDLTNAWNPVCVGQVYGIIGKVKLHPDSEWRLLLIKQRSLACELAGQRIYKISKIAVLPLNSTDVASDLDLELCKTHHYGMKKSEKTNQSNDNSQISQSLRGTWNSIKSAAENVKSKKKETKDKERFEKRILEELLKMYNDSDFFYYSDNFDLTNSLQRQNSATYDKNLPLWKRTDSRFFWNQHMLLELMETDDPLSEHWMMPVIQGYVQTETCVMDFDEDRMSSQSDMSSSVDYSSQKLEPLGYKFSIISRRSRHRAGTRSRTRGINSSGACANYVETEQIIEFTPHLVSFVQVRGSIPVFWSQSGLKYRPPPRLDKDEKESYEAFALHFQEQLSLYQKVAIISLVEQAGKEHVIGDAYLSHVLKLNSPSLTYVTFDFHEYCRGMRFENVSILTDGIKDVIKEMRYCWVDNKGVICEQQGVFRVNCVDCLDRTNVVQTAIARIVMETQFRKLGLLPPEESLPGSCRRTYQQIWANNGDVISRQYAGTAALKGDFTRTGERKFSGMMKDGVNSANRYYLRFRDAYRQAAIDLTLGQPVSESLMVPSGEVDDVDGTEGIEKEENVKMVIEDCKRMLIVEPEHCLGGWALINADPVLGDSEQQDLDMILLLSQRSVYVAWYDDEQELVSRYQRIYLEDIDKIEIGMEPAVFKSRHPILRITYHDQADEELFHVFRVPTTRFFNNKATAVVSQDEAKESLRIIADAFRCAQEMMSIKLEIIEKPKLDKKKASSHPGVMDVHQQLQENSLAGIRLPRDVSAYMETSGQFEESKDSRHLDASSLTVPRSKSPLEFLNVLPSFPKSALPSFSAAVNPLKFSIPKTNLKENLQQLNLMRKIKLNKDSGKVDVRNVDQIGNDNKGVNITSDQKPTLILKDEDNKEVVLDSCGILATSPSQILLSSMHLKAENKRKSSVVDLVSSPHSVRSHTSQANSSISEGSRFNFHIDTAVGDENFTKHSSALAAGDDLSEYGDAITGNFDDFSDKTDMQNAAETAMEEVSQAEFDRVSENGTNEDEEYCVMENEEVRAILDKCHQLHHPLMKTSISDTSLSLSAAQETLMQPSIAQKDSGLVSMLKSKMAGFSKTSPGRSPEPLLSKTHIRKSQRAMEVFEKLIKEKLPDEECKSYFIFI